ncbi:MAG: hypothetical protein NTZ95_08610 [Candidatus Omnitrophica bacterium]|nr:hypothetical protein [Candidatus Omnitrophota bacterium]
MRNILAALAIIGMLVSPAFAQEAKEAIGVVDSIDSIDPARGDYDGGIVLKDTTDSVKDFDINITTVISDQATGKINSTDIQDGDKVKVVYSESDRGAAAITILRLPTGEVAKTPTVIDAGNERCPVMGNKVNGKDFYEYNGKRYGLCCSMCPAAFAKDPAKYAAIADKEVNR